MARHLARVLALAALTVSIYGCAHQNTTNASAATYTCPMHPEVASEKPGSCPKCGMALVAKK